MIPTETAHQARGEEGQGRGKAGQAGRAQIRVRPQLDVRDGIAMASRIAN
jgi:hypothetical protein